MTELLFPCIQRFPAVLSKFRFIVGSVWAWFFLLNSLQTNAPVYFNASQCPDISIDMTCNIDFKWVKKDETFLTCITRK